MDAGTSFHTCEELEHRGREKRREREKERAIEREIERERVAVY